MKELGASLLSLSVEALTTMILLNGALAAAALVIYLAFRRGPDGKPRSFIGFLLKGFLVGAVAGFAGLAAGILFFCSLDLGNLCGLGGVFLTGPAALDIAVVIYLVRWARASS